MKIKKPCVHNPRLAVSLPGYTFTIEKINFSTFYSVFFFLFLTLHAFTIYISASKLVYIWQFLVVYMTAKPTFIKTATQIAQCNLSEMIQAW